MKPEQESPTTDEMEVSVSLVIYRIWSFANTIRLKKYESIRFYLIVIGLKNDILNPQSRSIKGIMDGVSLDPSSERNSR